MRLDWQAYTPAGLVEGIFVGQAQMLDGSRLLMGRTGSQQWFVLHDEDRLGSRRLVVDACSFQEAEEKAEQWAEDHFALHRLAQVRDE